MGPTRSYLFDLGGVEGREDVVAVPCVDVADEIEIIVPHVREDLGVRDQGLVDGGEPRLRVDIATITLVAPPAIAAVAQRGQDLGHLFPMRLLVELCE